MRSRCHAGRFSKNTPRIAEIVAHGIFRPKSEPITAIGDPPTGNADGDSGADGPPKWQCEIGEETADREDDPEHFALHGKILAGRDVVNAAATTTR